MNFPFYKYFDYDMCDVVCYRENEGEANTLNPLDLNKQALRKIGKQGSTVKMVVERNGKLIISVAL